MTPQTDLRLTRKQRRFVDEYLSNGYNGTRAAIAAGYSPQTARGIASENLKKPYIASVIEAGIRLQSSKKRRPSNYIYLMQAANGLIKIGMTYHPQRRLEAINGASPMEVKLLCVFSDSLAETSERELHAYFADKRVRGEWFALSDADVAWIQQRYQRNPDRR